MPMIASGALQDVGFRGCHFEKGRRRHWTTIGDGGVGGEGTDDGDDDAAENHSSQDSPCVSFPN